MAATATKNPRPLPSGSSNRDNTQSPPPGARQPIRIASLTSSSLNQSINNRSSSSASRRAPLPQRTESSPQLQLQYQSQNYSNDDDNDNDNAWRKSVVREQIDVQTLRDMAKFLRTTEPSSLGERASIETQRNCFGAAVNVESKKRWSLQSRWRSKKSLRDGDGDSEDSSSVASQLPSSVVRSTTVGGHNYIAISLPSSQDSSPHPALAKTVAKTGLSLSSEHPKIDSNSSSSSNNNTPSSPIGTAIRQSQPQSPSRTNEVKSEEEPNDHSSGNDADYRSTLLARDSSLRLYGAMLRLLGPSPVEEDKNTKSSRPDSIHEKEEEDKDGEGEKVMTPTTDQANQSPTTLGKPDDRSYPSRSTSAYSIVPRPSSSSKWGSGKQPTSHSRTGSLANHASKLSLKREKSSPVLKTSTTKPEKAAASSTLSSRDNKPGHIVIAPRSMLQVPQQDAACLTPDSPGFPMMLAAMTFPSPPESSLSHYAKDSISSRATLPSPSSLSAEPASITVTATDSAEQAESLASPNTSADAGSHLEESRQSLTSTVTDTDVSESNTTDSRQSLLSETTVTSDAVMMDNKDDHQYYSKGYVNHSASHSLHDVLSKKRSRWSLKDGESTEDGRSLSSHRLSQTSFMSNSSIATNATDSRSALADRRRARREKVREKIQNDLSTSPATKPNHKNGKNHNHLKVTPGFFDGAGALLPHAVDSPVLGYFSASASPMRTPMKEDGSGARSAKHKSANHRPSPLATSSAQMAKQHEENTTSGDEFNDHTSKDNSLIKEEESYPEEQIERSSSAQSNLCVSPVMVTANIEPGPAPLSILSSGLAALASALPSFLSSPQAPQLDGNSGDTERQHVTDKSRTVMRQRPVPIKVSQPLVRQSSARLPVVGEKAPDSVALKKRYRQSVPVTFMSDPSPSITSSTASSSAAVSATSSSTSASVSSSSSSSDPDGEKLKRWSSTWTVGRQSLPSSATGKPSSVKSHDETNDRPSPDKHQRAASSILSRLDEQRWLQAHQRQSVQEWRQAAWKERERMQQQPQVSKEDENAVEVTPSRRKSRVSFIMDGAMNIEDAAVAAKKERMLKRRTTGSLGALWEVPKSDNTASENGSEDSSKKESTAHAASTVEERLRRLEMMNGTEWNDVVIPLLERMNYLLSEINLNSATGGANGKQ